MDWRESEGGSFHLFFWAARRAVLISTLFLIALASCSPVYVIRAAYEQGKILVRRQPIERVIEAEDTDPTQREKLRLVLEARAFATELGLDPGDSFTKFSKVDRDVLAWVLLGSKPDSFSLYTWWFPIVGSVPYKGFFEKDDAEKAAAALQAKGYETWLRGTQAFSTLGWFNDPLLSTTLNSDHVSIADTVIHESVHSTIWIKNRVDFNESLANFVGSAGAVQFFQAKLNNCLLDDMVCAGRYRELLAKSILARKRDRAMGAAIGGLHHELKELYRSNLETSSKLELRTAIFEKHVAPLKQQYPDLKILKSINNAEIMQLKLYLTGQEQFDKLLLKCSGDIPCFMKALRGIEEQLSSSDDPFKLLERWSENPPKQ
ncbi:MAG: aminopeptidase [Deltaproteobacteria bacterium]|nr:aminopeptidase [Deltaproteobacteria bacterium]